MASSKLFSLSDFGLCHEFADWTFVKVFSLFSFRKRSMDATDFDAARETPCLYERMNNDFVPWRLFVPKENFQKLSTIRRLI
jgi:hypothetical protein